MDFFCLFQNSCGLYHSYAHSFLFEVPRSHSEGVVRRTCRKPEGFCLPCKGRWASLRQTGGIRLPCKGRWVAVKASRRDFIGVYGIYIERALPFNPSVRSQTRVQLLTGARPLCHYVTFPHTVGNHPFQGSLNNPSVICAIASLVKGGGLPSRQAGGIRLPCKGRWVAAGKPEGFSQKRLQKSALLFNPSVIFDDSSLYKGA